MPIKVNLGRERTGIMVAIPGIEVASLGIVKAITGNMVAILVTVVVHIA